MHGPIHPIAAGIKHFSFVILAVLTCTVTTSLAEQSYISDVLVVNIRDNIKQPHTVVTRVTSDEPVMVLENQDKHMLIETTDGKRGWVASQYVTSQPPKSLQIHNLEKQLQATRDELDKLRSAAGNNSDSGEYEQLRIERETLLAEVEQLRRQSIDKNTLEATFSRLQADHASLIDQNEILKEQLAAEKTPAVSPLPKQNNSQQGNRELWPSKYYNRLLFGAVIFLSGVLSGRMMVRKRKRIFF